MAAPGTWLLVESAETDLGEVFAGEERVRNSAIVARVFATGEWRLVATVTSMREGMERLEWRSSGASQFAPFTTGAPVEIARGMAGAAGELIRVDLRVTTKPTTEPGFAEFLIDLRLEQR